MKNTTKQPDDQAAAREATIQQICDDFEEHPSLVLCRTLFDAGYLTAAAEQRSEQPAAEVDAEMFKALEAIRDCGMLSHCDICRNTARATLERIGQPKPQPAEPLGDVCGTGCICKGNWRNIVKEYEPLFNQIFIDKDGGEWSFWGIVHANDDYYYLLTNADKYRLGTCVGSLEDNGFTLRLKSPSPSMINPAPTPLAVEADVDLRTALAYEAGQRAERVRIADELEKMLESKDDAASPAWFWLNIKTYITKLRGEQDAK